MTFAPLARLAGASLLALSLAACMDVSMSVDVLSETEAEAKMVTSMQADMVAMMEAQTAESGERFCERGEIVERGNILDCIITQSGPFDALDLQASEEEGPFIEAIGNGQVRVSFPTGTLTGSFEEMAGTEQDPQMMAMLIHMFEGHTLTMSVTGGDIVDTNMERDGQTAIFEVPIAGVLQGTFDLPEEVFAVVQK